MKYSTSFFMVYFCFFSFVIFSQGKIIREDMVVINVEVPVRVMHKGNPVDNLKKSDFRLFENGKELSINGFNIVRKKISSQSIGLDSERKQFYEPRLFSLVFSLVQYNRDLEDGLIHIFDKVLKKSDKLLILINNKMFSFNDLKKKDEAFELIKKHLKNEGLIARARLTRTLLKVQGDLSIALSSKRPYAHYVLYDYLKHYLRTFKDYKRDFLTADINKYYNFSKYLEKIKMKKWVISFYQVELFPRLSTKMDSLLESIRGYIERWRMSTDPEVLFFARQLEKMIFAIFREQSAAISFDTDEITKLFYKVNTTFHSVLIPSRIPLESKNFEYKRISTSLENNLREITKKTGGKLITTTNLSDAIETISESQDIVYMITYAPETETFRGKLNVKVGNKEYKVLYDDNVRAGYLKRYLKKRAKKYKIVEIEKISFEKKKLSIKLKNYKISKSGNNKRGKVNIQITVKDGNNVIFNENKIVLPGKKEINVDIGFDWINKGQYDLLIDIKDLLTDRSAFEYLKIDVK